MTQRLDQWKCSREGDVVVITAKATNRELVLGPGGDHAASLSLHTADGQIVRLDLNGIALADLSAAVSSHIPRPL